MHILSCDEIVPGNFAVVACGDDDRQLVENEKIEKNVGKMEAAAAVGGVAVFPIFPKGADSRLSDFNDLATKTGLGIEGLKQQTRPAMARVAANAKTQVSNMIISRNIAEKKAQGRENLEGRESELKAEKEVAREKTREKAKKRGLTR